MKPTEINLSPTVTALLLEIQKESKQLSEKLQTLNSRVNDLITGILLNNNLDLTNGSIKLDPEFTKIIVEYPEAKNQEQELNTEVLTEQTPKKAVKKTLPKQ